ncbi:hypothetical protein Acr_07g0003290 [Actinidia rufa]|uniref:Uncharacterized protein n=1 Tax=Actinidia rufa TaxID=165716 RepID=A0A7J0EUS9_9ERIC|nr:hypothetical protein Acr_07g0003290 [Actinidia rufa]
MGRFQIPTKCNIPMFLHRLVQVAHHGLRGSDHGLQAHDSDGMRPTGMTPEGVHEIIATTYSKLTASIFTCCEVDVPE